MFRFKQFTVCQDRCPMKVGTDAVLLGAWVGVRATDRRVLDIGTGTGVIALMLAQRSEARITAIDIDPACAEQASGNFAASSWGDRLETQCLPVQQYKPAELFDLIVSNPPYFVDSLRSPDEGRNTARHAVDLTFEELTTAALRLLAPGGRFALVLPPAEMQRFKSTSLGRLFPARWCEICSTPRRGVRRILAEFVAEPTLPPSVERLVIENGGPDSYTPEYRQLTGAFYLKF
ncbi:methyltransferase [uncultured Alistipes sp.]|uniref:tRNA1(Val) (adenine(37)-N6)-methyltransferase n=1 Tax=uncultured Alistipes sp. TaxID=538949 RepID=UPI00260CD7EE|nr:methyltransferase [uncultured Alistipes sp.]